VKAFERVWDWTESRISPYGAVIAMAASVIPIPFAGYSLGALWGSVLYHVRIDIHPAVAYIIALAAIAIASRRLVRRVHAQVGASWSLFLLSCSVVGAFYGVIRFVDIVTITTGVS